jgi:hypothetical protein
MRRIRLLGLTLVAVLALAGLAGGTASAATLCNIPASPCPAANVVPAPFLIAAQAVGPVTFSMGANTVTCGTSGFTDQILNNPGMPINDLIQKWTFGNCLLQPGNVPCTVVANPNPPPLNWPTRISTPGTVWAGSQGDFAVDNFNVTITCGGLPPCNVFGAGGAQNITGGWFNPGVPSPPKPVASPHSEVAFNSPIVGGPAPCGPGAFKGAYEVTLPPFPGPDLWLV